jgi:hypothetical protein
MAEPGTEFLFRTYSMTSGGSTQNHILCENKVLCLIKHHAINTYGLREIQLRECLTSTPVGDGFKLLALFVQRQILGIHCT